MKIGKQKMKILQKQLKVSWFKLRSPLLYSCRVWCSSYVHMAYVSLSAAFQLLLYFTYIYVPMHTFNLL